MKQAPHRCSTPLRRRAARSLLLFCMVPSLVGCTDALDRLLAVEAPGNVLDRDLQGPGKAGLLLASAIADFDCALSHYIVSGGLIGNELSDAQQTAAQWDFDRRSINSYGDWYGTNTCSDRLGAYTPISTARWAADDLLKKLDGWSDAEVPNRQKMIATAAAYAGYGLILLGEGFCTASVDAGPELTRAQVFALAEQRFGRAIETAGASGASEILNLARVGRARARLNLGRLAEAAADARQVPEAFVHYAHYSTASTRSENNVFVMNNRSRNVSVDAPYHNVEFAGVPDPRVRVLDTRTVGSNGQTRVWAQQKYADGGSRIPMARWAEAQLIIAEAVGGPEAVRIINDLHARAGLPRFVSSDPEEIRRHVVEERRRELFLEGHHLADLYRYKLPLYPAPGTPFVNGGVHGDLRCMPLPDVERFNNPNIGS